MRPVLCPFDEAQLKQPRETLKVEVMEALSQVFTLQSFKVRLDADSRIQ